MITILTWNVRGIGGIASQRRLRKLCKLHNVSILFLLEPFISSDHLPSLASALGFTSFLASANGKIWILWRHNIVLTFSSQTDQLYHVQCSHPAMLHSCALTSVYAKCTAVARRQLWSDLLHLQSEIRDQPWLLCGDFNAILNLGESAGRAPPNVQSMTDFADFLSRTDFRELPTVGGVFTWTGVRRQGRVWSYLAPYTTLDWIVVCSIILGFNLFQIVHLSCSTEQHLTTIHCCFR